MLLISLISNFLRILLWPVSALRRARAAPRGGYVTVELDGSVVDLPPRRARLEFLRRPGPAPTALSTLRELARLVAHDDRVAGLLFRVSALSAGPAVLASLRDLLSEVRASGKDVVVHLPTGADTQSLYVASAARMIVVGPETLVAPLGYAVHGRYVKSALTRAGVEAEVFAKGMYKSAGEALVRDTMSDAQREQLGALLEAHHDELVSALARGRRVDRDTARRWIDEAPHGADRAVALGIVDAVAYDDELAQRITGSAPLKTVTARRYLSARRAGAFRPLLRPPVIGVIEIHGAIVSRARFGFAKLASEDRVVGAIRAARRSSAVRGAVLHIDSRGGSAVASNRIHHEVMRLAEVKPVVAYMADVAASGGYYIASAAHAIVAQPQTVTGSIGVIATRLVVAPLLERLGVFTSVVKRGARADLFSTARHLDEGERASFERELEAFYQTFLAAVAKGRGRSIEEIEPLARGRIYSGTEAHARGLLDHLGGFDRAVHAVRDLLGQAGKGLDP